MALVSQSFVAPHCPVVVQVIEAAFPEHAILGEEGGVAGNTASEYLWVIDPLDGTTNFSRGYPSFAVSVAVLRHGTPLAATVVEFVGGPQAWSTRTFTASRNRGAFCNDIPISVSRVAELSKSLLVWGGLQRPAGNMGGWMGGR